MIGSAALPDEGVQAPPVPEARAAANDTQSVALTGDRVVRSSKAALRFRLYLGLVAVDAMAVILSFALANLIRFGDPLYAQDVHMIVLVLPIFIGIAMNSRAYSIDVLERPLKGVRRAAQSLAAALATVIGILFYLKASDDFSRIVMALGGMGALLLVCGSRWLFGQIAGKRHQWRFTNELLFVDQVPVFPERGETVIFADKAELTPATDDPKLLDRVGRLLQNCDRVIVACPPERRAAWSAMLKGADVNIEVLAPELDSLGALGIGRFGERSTVTVCRGPLGLRDRIAKRAFDLALTVPAVLLLLPVFAAIAVAIKLDSPGPVFFRQPRVGLGSRLFEILKFRSMRVDSADSNGDTLTQVGDMRVTRIGDFLRKSSLDELPQLFNVLMGHMSIAGPRPHPIGALAGESLYWEVDSRYWHRHAVKPGMTGLAQVRGFRGTTFEKADLSKRLQADLEYLTKWSIWGDMGIIARTVRVVIHEKAF